MMKRAPISKMRKMHKMQMMRWGILFLVYLVLGSGVYAISLDNGFHYDDRFYIVNNEGLRSLSNLPALFVSREHYNWDPRYNFHYRPLVTSSYLLNVVTGGLDPVGFHLVNLAFHLVAAFLVAAVLYRLCGDFRAGGLGGAIFLLHPLNAEAVNYLTARSSQMYAVFFLLSFYAYLRFHPPMIQGRPHPSPPKADLPGMRSRLFLGLSFAAFLASMASKEMAVSLPLLLFLYEGMFRCPREGREWLRAMTFPAVFALSVILPYFAIRAAVIGGGIPIHFTRDLTSQWATQTEVLVHTLYLFFVPISLTIDHRLEVFHSFTDWPVVGYSILILGIFSLMIACYRSASRDMKLSAFLLLWFFVSLVPIMIYPLNALLQENRLYLAIAGLIGIMAVGGVRLWDRVRRRSATAGRLVLAGMAGLLLTYGGLTLQRNAVWQDDISLWTDAVAKYPTSPVSLDNLAVAYGRAGQWDRAVVFRQRSLAIAPNNPIAVFNMGFAMKEQGRLNEAVLWYQRAIRIDPGLFQAYFNLGMVYERQGLWEDAVKAYRQGTVLSPTDVPGRRRLADALLQTGRPEEAVLEYESILRSNATDPELVSEVRRKLSMIRKGKR